MFDKLIAFLHSNILDSILIACLALSEALPFSDSVKSNGLFQALVNGLKFAKEKLFPPKA